MRKMMVTSTTLPRIPRGMVSEQIQLARNKRAISLWGVIERWRDVAKIGKRLQNQRDPVPIDLAAKTPDKLYFVRLQQKVFDQILMSIGVSALFLKKNTLRKNPVAFAYVSIWFFRSRLSNVRHVESFARPFITP